MFYSHNSIIGIKTYYSHCITDHNIKKPNRAAAYFNSWF